MTKEEINKLLQEAYERVRELIEKEKETENITAEFMEMRLR